MAYCGPSAPEGSKRSHELIVQEEKKRTEEHLEKIKKAESFLQNNPGAAEFLELFGRY